MREGSDPKPLATGVCEVVTWRGPAAELIGLHCAQSNAGREAKSARATRKLAQGFRLVSFALEPGCAATSALPDIPHLGEELTFKTDRGVCGVRVSRGSWAGSCYICSQAVTFLELG